MITEGKKHSRNYGRKPKKDRIWGKGGKEDVKFYQSKYWRGIRGEKLRRDPWCEECEIEPANVVDHILERHEGGTEDDDNLRSLCASCHNRKSAKYSHVNR